MSLRARIDEARLALMLLTRLPAGRLTGTAPPLGASAWAWPLVGACVGAIAALVFAAAHGLSLSPAICALLASGAAILVTGGLHEDGLADLADSAGGRDRAHRLEIMRDSRIGSFGMLALALVLALRVAALAQIATPETVGVALIAVAMASRAMMALWARLLPPARPDGMGHSTAQPPRGALGVALALAALALATLGGAGLGVALAVGIAATLVAGHARVRLGGQTGDVLGAIQILSETCGLLACAALL
ncbi:cobalamin synthase [Thioclava dalianensis]|uniref:Adenosylcobinamide-GDP ribazoletransferase n=1 Tax=Thioclava dalianensis TaxID=1185766 RepID=A0A074U0D2_9RHOB|nr:adenosylcobinamide-GDP ribazoletransferase [Thioclava dalianensis]KEP68147.1 cobalamin synthase [Thioclava dalianensis]SFN39729.1 cobalamin-5'-phosphate synthase [Thioclava dalianensis]